MFDIIVREAASRFGLGDRAATLVQTVVAYVINRDTGGIAGLVQRFRDAGLGDIAQSWVSGGTQAQAMTTTQSEVMFGQKGGLLDMVTSKLGISRELALPALGYILPSVIGKLTPNGSIPSNVPDEVHQFVGAGAASEIAGRSHMMSDGSASDGSGLWKWLALLAAGVLAVLLLMKCSDTENPTLPSENIAPVETVTDAVSEAADSAMESAGNTADGVVDAVEQAGDAAGSVAGEAVDGATDAVQKAGEIAGDAADTATDAAADAVEKAGDVAGDAANAAGTAADAAADAVKKAGDAVGGAAGKALDGAADAVEKTGEAAGNAADATAEAAGAAKDAIVGLFVDTSKDVLKKASEDKKVQLAERDGVPVMKVFFDTGKYDVSPAFKDLSADMVKHMADTEAAKIVVQGFNDPSGDAAANEKLSKNRAQAVRDALVALGVAEERIELRKPNSTVPEGGSFEEMRRVEVTAVE